MDERQIWGNNRSIGGRVGGGKITPETRGKEMRREGLNRPSWMPSVFLVKMRQGS